MDWDKLKSFYEIAISKSISRASAKLNISQSALSRQIQDLEYDLKTPLFIRHQKGVRLTEQGENLFNTVSQINNSVSSFEKTLIDKKTRPVGKFTISTTVGFGSTWLTPRITKFTDQFPDMELIPNGEVNDLATFKFFQSKNITQFMIGRQFAKDAFFLEKLDLENIKRKTTLIINTINELEHYKYLNINLLKKSIFTALSNISNSKKVKKEISVIDNYSGLLNYFERNAIWS